MATSKHAVRRVLVATALFAVSGSCKTVDAGMAVNTTSGLFAPYFPVTHPGIASFPDIPYAESPTGPLRFAPPVPARARSNKAIYNTQLPAGCFQYVAASTQSTVIFNGQKAAEFQQGDISNTTEDCLHLSVFMPRATFERAARRRSPSTNCNALPVILWIHGGAVTFGGINVPYQLAPNWVQRTQSHIVVEIQYRLSLLGLPNAAGLAVNASENLNLNLAFLDQRLAVEWVRDNIASFGGDPARITLWGESAGGASVDTFPFAWAADPIAQGVIAASGNALSIEIATVDSTNHSTFSLAAGKLGCGGLSPADELACMRSVPAVEIQAYLQAPVGTGGAADDGLVFGTVVDNITAFADYPSRIKAGGDQFAAHIPLLIGTNTNEGGIWVPYDFPGSATTSQLPADLEVVAESFQLIQQCTTIREAQLRASAGAITYQYLYGGNFTDVSPRPWLGAYHTSELPMVFGTFGTEGEATFFETQVSERMQDLFLAFAKDAASGLQKEGWAPANGTARDWEVMRWGVDGEVDQIVSVEDMRVECVEHGWSVD